MPDPSESIGTHLRRAREAAGLSQRELARRSGVARSHVGLIERGLRPKVGAAVLVRLADALEVDPRALLGEVPVDELDALALDLAGAGAEDISVKLWPKRGYHGLAAVSWTQDGRKRAAEGSTLGTALRAAVRAAGAGSASISGGAR